MQLRFELGIKVIDKITGFKGTITGVARYITGCDQYLVAPEVGKDGNYIDAHWYDENRLYPLVGEEKIEIDNDISAGPCEPAPKK